MITAHIPQYLKHNLVRRIGKNLGRNIKQKDIHRYPCLILNFSSGDTLMVFKYDHRFIFNEPSPAHTKRYFHGVFDIIYTSQEGVIDEIKTTLTLVRVSHLIKKHRKKFRLVSFAVFYQFSTQILPQWKGVSELEDNKNEPENTRETA